MPSRGQSTAVLPAMSAPTEARLPDLSLALEGLIDSYLLTGSQQRLGRRERQGDLARIHYRPSGNRPAADHFFVAGIAPEAAVAQIRACRPAGTHQVHVLADRPGLALAYMGAGCSFRAPAHMLMVLALNDWQAPPTEKARRAGQADQDRLNKMTGGEALLGEDLADANLRFYYALAEGRPVAMVRAGGLGGGRSWVSHLYTEPTHRRQGLATSVMAALLADSQAAGEAISLLLATEMARGLYGRLGYREICPVLDFALKEGL